jgi:nitroreductase
MDTRKSFAMKQMTSAAPPSVAPRFPRDGNPSQQLEYLLRFAVLAPSNRNSQPWKFKVQGNQVELYADMTRSQPVSDPVRRELTLSCGAALMHLRVAIRCCGLLAKTEICPDPDQPELLATVALTGDAPPGRTDYRLFKAMAERHTNRLPFESRAIPRAVLYRWERAAAFEDALLHFVEPGPERECIADMIVKGDEILSEDPAYRDELAHWLRSNDSHERDGLPGFAIGLGDLASRVAPLATPPLASGGFQRLRSRDLVLRAPAFGVLGTEEDEPQSWMVAGQALARVLLAAQAEGISASFFLQPIEVPEIRERLRELLGSRVGFPHITFRFGYAPRVHSTPRRPLSEVVAAERDRTETKE